MTFGVPLTMLNFGSNEDETLITDDFRAWPVNTLINQYFLSLGAFSMGNYADHPKTGLCYIFFIGATFITQVTMLNMIIAIMGDSFEKVTEEKLRN